MHTLEQLKIFAAVCEHGSLSAAARHLGRAQSGVSQMIANLEIDLGAALFVRDKSGVVPTETARALLPEALAVLRQSGYFEQKLSALTRAEPPQFALAVEESLMSDGLAALAVQFEAAFPQTSLELIAAPTFDIEQMISDGLVQMGVAYKDFNVQKDLDFFFLGYNRFITVAAPQHPLAGVRQITPPQLSAHRHIVHRSLGRQELWFSTSLSRQCWYANSHQTLLQLACQNLGWADLPEKFARPYLESGRLVQLDLDFEPDGNLITVVGLHSRAHLRNAAADFWAERLQAFFR
ncbi:LysR family transcriptional regulator [Bergeriella denitrificans]|uniref:Transcriptional activator MetR n=1 Tax=Bergeriella denitrificans TaxID=494 RepID=A0A378UJ87_BERDE|nr:LysR family transcriptional regulator [Bergeriella denitrificans]STZ77397.1 transcriptional activator MetR [Bergeriella denitrificans]